MAAAWRPHPLYHILETEQNGRAIEFLHLRVHLVQRTIVHRVRFFDLNGDRTLTALVATSSPVLGEDAGRARNVEPFPSVARVTLALAEGADFYFFDTKLLERETKLFFASNLSCVIAGEVRVVNEQAVLSVCRLIFPF